MIGVHEEFILLCGFSLFLGIGLSRTLFAILDNLREAASADIRKGRHLP